MHLFPTLRPPPLALSSPDGQIVLRPFETADADFLLASFADPQARLHTPLVAPFNFDLAAQWIRDHSARGFRPHAPAFLITDAQCVRTGAIGATAIDWQHKRVEFFYWVLAPYRRRHFATRALQTISLWAESRGLTRLELVIDTSNAVSLKVAQSAGYHFERLYPGYRSLTGNLIEAAAYIRTPARV